MKRIHCIAWLVLFFLVRLPVPAEGAKPPFAHEPLGVANGCFVESVCLYDHFQEIHGPDSWVRVLQWGAKEDEQVVAGHAVAVFELEERLWVWDVNFGFRPLEVPPDSRGDVAQVAAPILEKYPGITPLYPIFRYDLPQSPEAHPPAVLATHLVPAFRDATRAGARLAAHRPVNVVRFSYFKDGVVQESAATVFVFNGRVCVYFPERGTIPFIMPSHSIINLGQLQQAFHSVYPGAFALQSLND